MKRIKLEITGIVQGVGFRPFIFNLAKDSNLTGFIFNNSRGVEIEVQGESSNIDKFKRMLKNKAPKAAVIDIVNIKQLVVNKKERKFLIKNSKKTKGSQRVSPDLCICEDCKKEFFDSNNKRYLYPFVNCTNCGPRFTIISKMPYDRSKTSMAKFKMCSGCAREYKNLLDRRFHAQPISCPDCGPVTQGKKGNSKQGTVSGKILGNEAIERAVRIIEKGGIVAIKGIGGFHLVCDAKNKKAIDKLRKRKNRPQKPFALIAKNIDIVKEYCFVSKEEEKKLQSSVSPIVLLKSKESGILNCVAPGINKLGIMLPYNPLHMLIFHNLKKQKLLVMTSGNISGEPIITDNKEAFKKLNNIADYFLFHNRDILTGYDDSIVQFPISNFQFPKNSGAKRQNIKSQVIRTGRGVAPVVIDFPLKAKNPILAVGADLKNTFCLVKEDKAIISQYIGDLENLSNINRFKNILENYKKIFNIKPKVFAHDLHPGYLSTKLAKKISGLKGDLLGVQHHHAHMASVYVENNLKGNVIGIVFDGTGFGEGEKNKIWGGEFFYGNFFGFKRIAHLEYFNLPGGDLSAKYPWRVAASMLLEIDRTKKLNKILKINEKELKIILSQINVNINIIESSSIGRLFDAVASILNIVQENTYEGEAAMRLESIIKENEKGFYNFSFMDGKYLVIDWKPVLEQIIHDLKKGLSKSIISAKFHNGISKMILKVCRHFKKIYSVNSVCLSGGVFQNSYLLNKSMIELEKAGFKVFINKKVPTNDSGISLGQAVIVSSRINK